MCLVGLVAFQVVQVTAKWALYEMETVTVDRNEDILSIHDFTSLFKVQTIIG